MVFSTSIDGATPKLIRSDSESRSLPRGEKAFSSLALAPSRKSKTAAAAMAITAHVDASAMPKRSPRWKVINMATQPDKRLRQVRKLGISETILFFLLLMEFSRPVDGGDPRR